MKKTNILCPCNDFKTAENNKKKKKLCASCRKVLKYKIVAKIGKRVYIDEDNAYRKPKK